MKKISEFVINKVKWQETDIIELSVEVDSAQRFDLLLSSSHRAWTLDLYRAKTEMHGVQAQRALPERGIADGVNMLSLQ